VKKLVILAAGAVLLLAAISLVAAIFASGRL
jgi:hypothetical protein